MVFFAIYQYETAMGAHVSPYPEPNSYLHPQPIGYFYIGKSSLWHLEGYVTKQFLGEIVFSQSNLRQKKKPILTAH